MINAVAVGQGFGTSPATIQGTFLDSGTEFTPVLGELQASQVADKHCRNLSYTVSSPNEIEAMALTVKEDIAKHSLSKFRVDTEGLVKYKESGLRNSRFIKAPVLVTLRLKPCP